MRLRLVLFAALGVAAAQAQSQLGTGAIAGVVQDSSGSVIIGAQITITQVETGLVREMVSGSGGQFTAPVLPTGRYTLRVTSPGFSALQQTDITVNVGSTATVTAVLKVGGVAETVTVEAIAQIDSTKTDESNLVNRKSIQDLPINGRRFFEFALLSPGVTRDGRFGLLSFRGASGNFNNFLIEGNDDNQAYFSENRGRYRVVSTL
ncbi:MAG: carboxypeptidase regulatory-like domain-containing protein, partial [Acidobacteria bacterium]|nr:carboxypeptidase regulatory-like domain-containing protein [Acidobacteriota bacterium]